MKRFIFCIVFILGAAIASMSQSAKDAAELTRLLNEFLAGAGRSDAAIHDRFWAKDLIYTRSAGVRINKAELMKGVRSTTAPKPDDPVIIYTADDIRIQQYGNAAIVAFKLIGTTTRSDGTKTVSNHLNTGTFIKRKGKWQAVAWQSTIVPKAEPPTALQAVPLVEQPTKATETKTEAASPPKSTPSGQRTYIKGPRGGCYYINSSGQKTYVEKSFCN